MHSKDAIPNIPYCPYESSIHIQCWVSLQLRQATEAFNIHALSFQVIVNLALEIKTSQKHQKGKQTESSNNKAKGNRQV